MHFEQTDLYAELQQISLNISTANDDVVWFDMYETLADRIERLLTENFRVWVAGRITEYPAWEIQGVFLSQERAAAAACEEGWFIGPVCLNEKLPNFSMEWPGAYYPIRLTPHPADAEQHGAADA